MFVYHLSLFDKNKEFVYKIYKLIVTVIRSEMTACCTSPQQALGF